MISIRDFEANHKTRFSKNFIRAFRWCFSFDSWTFMQITQHTQQGCGAGAAGASFSRSRSRSRGQFLLAGPGSVFSKTKTETSYFWQHLKAFFCYFLSMFGYFRLLCSFFHCLHKSMTIFSINRSSSLLLRYSAIQLLTSINTCTVGGGTIIAFGQWQKMIIA